MSLSVGSVVLFVSAGNEWEQREVKAISSSGVFSVLRTRDSHPFEIREPADIRLYE